MNAAVYRVAHSHKVGQCTWCRAATGHERKNWCEGTACIRAFLRANFAPADTEMPAAMPGRWREPWAEREDDVVRKTMDKSAFYVAMVLRRTVDGVTCRRQALRENAGKIRYFKRPAPPVSGLRRDGARWTEEEDARLRQLKAEGWGYKRLQSVFCRSRDSIRSRWRELNGAGRKLRR